MSCPFDLAHYGELLDAARAGGYRFAFFDREPQRGDVLLRHDVDMSLEAALTMAELEAEQGVAATYFLMTRSDFYNLDARAGVAALARLRELGHRVGLHGVYPDACLDDRFDPVVAWHTPDPEYMSVPLPDAVNAMQPGYFDPAHYRSDSNRHWRSGCPHDELAVGAFDWLQLLVHPEIWVYEGATMREKMVSQLDAERELRWRQLAENRIDLS
ncbi:MAG TPA: hypothetical protein VMU58_07720 [Gaiellaceae bacterium]|nr:hypothetical protein [Gaiellaceae bacterium]